MSQLKWVINNMPKTDDANLPIMSVEEVTLSTAKHLWLI